VLLSVLNVPALPVYQPWMAGRPSRDTEGDFIFINSPLSAGQAGFRVGVKIDEKKATPKKEHGYSLYSVTLSPPAVPITIGRQVYPCLPIYLPKA
jgi:hypothetical protein